MSQNHQLRDIVVKHVQSKIGLDFMNSKDLEIGIFNWTITHAINKQISQNWGDDRFVNAYKAKTISVITNLDKNSYLKNEQLLVRFKNKEFLIHDIPFMEKVDMCPDNWVALFEKKKQREALMLNSQNAGASTDQFKCSRCKSKECSYYEQQVKSSDEPMTIFVNCLNCGNKWKC
jgi:DNA-directed RNA polymerase subunit M/transcription elongation factor TFIIS